MRLIYTRDGFSKNEKAEWRIIIFQNIIDGLRMIVDAMEEFEIPFEFENTTVRPPDLLPRRYARPRPLLTSPGPPSHHYGGKRLESFRAHTDRVSTSLQRYVGRWRSPKGS